MSIAPAACDRLAVGVDYMVFDLAVNSGTSRAKRYVQRAAGVMDDEKIGPKTLAAIERLDPAAVVGRISDLRQAFYRSLDTFPTFGKGWMRWLTEVEALAKVWAQVPHI